MDNRVRDIFSQIHSEVTLKEKTADFLHAEIQARRRPKEVYTVKLVAIFSCFVLFLFIGGLSHNMYFTVKAYIDIDVNPSIELTLNRFDRVIEAVPYNDDGMIILKEVNVRHASYDKAIELLLDDMVQNGYLVQNDLLSVTVQTKDNNREDDLLLAIRSTVTTSLQAHHNDTQIDVFSVTEEVKKHAHESHISPAKYIAIAELQAVDSTANLEECKGHSISELKQLREQHEGVHHDAPSMDKDVADKEHFNGDYGTEDNNSEHDGGKNGNKGGHGGARMHH